MARFVTKAVTHGAITSTLTTKEFTVNDDQHDLERNRVLRFRQDLHVSASHGVSSSVFATLRQNLREFTFASGDSRAQRNKNGNSTFLLGFRR